MSEPGQLRSNLLIAELAYENEFGLACLALWRMLLL